MALIKCPGCDLPISTLVEACPRCGAAPDDPKGGRRRSFDRNPHYLLSVSVFCVGCFLFYRAYVIDEQTSTLSAALIASGLLWYLVARFWPR